MEISFESFLLEQVENKNRYLGEFDIVNGVAIVGVQAYDIQYINKIHDMERR